MRQSKNDLVQELCKRCLAQNKSCSQAWEILGLSLEKESDYEHAAECYEKVSSRTIVLCTYVVSVTSSLAIR